MMLNDAMPKTECDRNGTIKKYLQAIGSKGGAKSRRTITPEQQAKMQAGRKKKEPTK